MKEKLRYFLTSGFAKVAAWTIFAFCTFLMFFGKKDQKKTGAKQNEKAK